MTDLSGNDASATTDAAPMPEKGLFLLIDSLRFDTMSDPAARRFMFPNLARIVERGFVRRVVANAQSTQFVTPAIFSQTYPLDHGGYDNGIRNRPQSFAESLQQAGFRTHLLASCNQLGVATGYGRGFDTVRTTSDFRLLLEQRVDRTIRPQLDDQRAGKGERDSETIAREYALLLEGLTEIIEHHDKTVWPPRLLRINNRVADGCAAELELLKRDPQAVFAKLARIAPGIQWHFLGERNPRGLRLFVHRAVESVKWRTRRWIAAQTLWPFLAMSHYPVIFGDIIGPLCRVVEDGRDDRWFIYMHMMDVHDCRSISRPLHLLARLRYLPRWAIGRLRGYTRRRWLYDTALMYVDGLLGRLLKTLERTGQLEDTVILATGDHGLYYAESPRAKSQIGSRTHYEDLEIPLVLANSHRQPADAGMIDSMSMTATFLDALGVPAHESFRGVSVFGGGKPAIVSESCGRGNADIMHRKIYFTVTSPTHKMMATLDGDRLAVEQLYDKQADPRELRNIVDDPAQCDAIDRLTRYLRAERAELFALREAKSASAPERATA
ncbi:MAG: sulfatase-like hydrolase/transferase [Alphaproteobacteria bacterium]|jgi:arylsulfatase A-like enzyme